MNTLTIQIVTGSGWYTNQVGKKYEVVKGSSRYFSGYLNHRAKIDKNHAVVVAINYETAAGEVQL